MSSWLRDQASDVLDATRFLSRLPLPAPAGPPRPLAVTLRFAPLAGLVIAAGPALVLWGAVRGGLSSLVAASLATGCLVLATGALHEDGWADVADGFGGGSTVRRKLEIMRDSRIGAYGVLALGLGLLLRVASLQSLVEGLGAGAAAFVFVGAAVLSRALMLLPMALLPPARADGLARVALRDGTPMFGLALGLGLPVAAGLGFAILPNKLQVAAALVLSGAAALALTRLARRQIGGVTGDVIGATQQVSEIAFLLVICAGASPA